MKLLLISFCCLLVPCTVFSQGKKEEPRSWTTQLSYTQQRVKDSTEVRWSDLQGFGVRFISPNFKIETDGDYWTEEEEKNPEKFKKARFFCEIMYAPKHIVGDLADVSEFSVNGNLMYSVLHIKRFNLYAESGLRTYFIYSREYGLLNFKKIYYWDYGAAAQLDLGFVVPFIENRRFRYWTVGMELRLHPVYKKPKRKYKLHNKRFRVS